MRILKIPFISRPKAKSKSIWFAKFLFDEETWKILEQWCELLEWSQFRWKNLNKKLEYYWRKFNKDVINFRKKIMENDLITETLSKEKLDIVNKYFFENLTTFLNFDEYTTWSNVTWAEEHPLRAPYIIFGWKYNQLLFVNFFNIFKISKNLKTNLRKSWNFEEIDLEKYFELFPEIYKDFMNSNKILFTSITSEEINSETQKIDNQYKKDIVENILDENFMIWENPKIIKEKRISILRRIFKNRLRNIKPSDHLFWKLPEDMCEAAHIFPVSEIKKLDLEKWKMIADENNWLNLPTQIHKLYDSKKIFFDESWEIIFTNEIYKESLDFMFFWNKNYKILENILTKNRKNYIKMYNQKFITKK